MAVVCRLPEEDRSRAKLITDKVKNSKYHVADLLINAPISGEQASSGRRPVDFRPQPLIMLWAVAGVVGILTVSVLRLGRLALTAAFLPWDAVHWVFLVFWLPFMAYSEGYRGFQLRFAPVVAARSWYLATEGRSRYLSVLFAPLFSMGFVGGGRTRMLRSWILTIFIVGFVLVARQLAQPWRGLVDMGVVVGLSWGIVAIVVSTWRGLHQGVWVDPQLTPPEAKPNLENSAFREVGAESDELYIPASAPPQSSQREVLPGGVQ